MDITDIVSRVRKAIDEEAVDNASFGNASAGDSSKMDNIIKASIGTALQWVCENAPTSLLGGTDDTTEGEPVQTGIMVDNDEPDVSAIEGQTAGKITLGADFIKLARVRVSDWHRAITVPISEDSEEYLQLYDTNGATATADRPQAALIAKSTRELEIWPWSSGKSVSLTYVAAAEPAPITEEDEQHQEVIVGYAFPPRAASAIIYYIAFLVLSAYGDARAARMLEIAMMNIGQKP